MAIVSDRNIHRGFHTTHGVSEALDREAGKQGITRSLLIHHILETELIRRGHTMVPFVDRRNLEIPFVEGTVHPTDVSITETPASGAGEGVDGMGQEVPAEGGGDIQLKTRGTRAPRRRVRRAAGSSSGETDAAGS